MEQPPTAIPRTKHGQAKILCDRGLILLEKCRFQQNIIKIFDIVITSACNLKSIVFAVCQQNCCQSCALNDERFLLCSNQIHPDAYNVAVNVHKTTSIAYVWLSIPRTSFGGWWFKGWTNMTDDLQWHKNQIEVFSMYEWHHVKLQEFGYKRKHEIHFMYCTEIQYLDGITR